MKLELGLFFSEREIIQRKRQKSLRYKINDFNLTLKS